MREARLPPRRDGAAETSAARSRWRWRLPSLYWELAVWGGEKMVECGWRPATLPDVYQAPEVNVTLKGDQLSLHVKNISEGDRWDDRSSAALLPDHGKIIHLYAIRMPEMDAAYHLHPDFDPPSYFPYTAPRQCRRGEYALYGDVVHANGFPGNAGRQAGAPRRHHRRAAWTGRCLSASTSG